MFGQQVANDIATSLGSSDKAQAIAIVLGAVGTLVASVVGAYKSVRNGQKATKIQEQTNGHLSKLREDLVEERSARVATELELRTVYAVFSARLGMPVADLRQMIREEDAQLLPPVASGKPRRPPPIPLPKRRRTDKPAARDRRGDGNGDT